MSPIVNLAVESTSRPLRLLKLREVIHRTALSRSEIYRRLKCDSGFPKPIKLGTRSVAFYEAEVDAYVIACVTRRNGQVAQ